MQEVNVLFTKGAIKRVWHLGREKDATCFLVPKEG